MTPQDFRLLPIDQKMDFLYAKLYDVELLLLQPTTPKEHTCEHSGITFPIKN